MPRPTHVSFAFFNRQHIYTVEADYYPALKGNAYDPPESAFLDNITLTREDGTAPSKTTFDRLFNANAAEWLEEAEIALGLR